GHEDHIGAVPFLAKKLDVKLKIFGTKLTLGLVENKLVEHGVQNKVTLVTIKEKQKVALGHFEAEFIHVSHSVAGSVAISLKTPVGTVLHTGDFKIDYTPLGNEIMNLNRIAEIGKEGVLLLLSESTNVEKPGYTMSEAVVKETMNKLFSDAKGRRIIIATFASNVDRLEMIIALARQYKRKVAVSGRSMVKYIETAKRVGQFSFDNDLFVDIDRINSIEDGKLVILSTGSQGEPMSALTRMASGEFNKVKIGSNDTIILSSKPIVGNERDVYNVINNLYKLGATVIYSSLANVHVSGHACQEELKLIYTLVQPKYFIPVHGEYRHLKRHATLVEGLGHNPNNLLIPEIGDTVYVDKGRLEFSDKVPSGDVLVDGLCVSESGNLALKDRLALAQDGILIVSLGVSKKSGAITSGPEVIGKGCFINDEQGAVCIAELKNLIPAEIAKCRKQDATMSVKTAVTRTVRHYFKTKVKRNPVVLPVILET
ncbi:MAG: ribonuclease J, partial [Clostridia bacterium]|nr:ribonuclease J [Clostridia bacterium]